MNKERFLEFQSSIDKDLLEEAQNHHKEKVNWLRYAALAACFCAVIAGVLAWRPWRPLRMGASAPAAGAYVTEEASASEYGAIFDTYAAFDAAPSESETPMYGFAEMPVPEPSAAPAEEYREEPDAGYAKQDSSLMTFGVAEPESADNSMGIGAQAAMPNPVRECTLEELAEMGFDILLPEGAETVFIAVIDRLAEVKFLYGGCEYLLRTMRTAETMDISGVYDTVREAFSWSNGGTEFEIREGSEGIVFSWYSADDGVQWCLWSRDCGPETLLKTAGEIRGAEIPAPTEDVEDSK